MAEREDKRNEGSFSIGLLVKTKKTGVLKPLTIDNIDIIECYFIEDIFSFSMVGKLVFVDRVGAVEFLPFTGNEEIVILFGQDKQYELRFPIYSVSNIEQFSQQEAAGQSIIELYFTDVYFKPLTQKKYSRGWTNTKISTIVEEISDKMLGITDFVTFEDSNEKIDFYMPYWTPAEALKWLMCRASGAESGNAGYLYYINKEGANFVTLDTLFSATNIEMDDNKTPMYYMFTNLTEPSYINTMLSWQMSSIDNFALSGLKGGHRLGWDFTKKQLIDKSYEYSDIVKKMTFIGKKTLFPDISDDTARFINLGEENEKTMDNIFYSDFVKKYARQMALIMILRGHERRQTGSMISIQWPSSSRDEYVNKPMEGKYLVKSLTHQFSSKTAPAYRQKVIVLKNAYTDMDYKGIVKATKVNMETNVKKIGR